jgi:hypothetical protein
MDIERNAPATKSDIADFRSEMIATRGDLAAMEERLKARLLEMKAEFLKAFHDAAEALRVR